MGVIAFVIRFLLWLLMIRLAVRAVASFFGPSSDGPKKGRDLVRDRVCNTFVPQDRAVVAMVGGKPEYFCSAACRDRALLQASPAS